MSRLFLIVAFTLIAQGVPAASFAQHLYIVHVINAGLGTFDSHFDGYTPLGGGWSPTKYSLYFGGELMDVGSCHHCKADVPLRASLFDPAKVVQSH